MVDYTSLISIFRNIAQRHQADVYKRLNSFVVLYDEKDFSSPSFGRNYLDANNGTYWLRNGITPDKDCKEYGVLFIQLQSSFQKSTKEKCYNIRVGVGFPEVCEDCPENIKYSKEMLDMYAEDVLYGVLREFYSYKLYKDADGNGYWMTDSQKENCGIDTGLMFCDQILHNVTQEDKRVFSGIKGVDLLHIKDTNLTICGCSVDKQEFIDCHEEDESSFAMVKCNTCL